MLRFKLFSYCFDFINIYGFSYCHNTWTVYRQPVLHGQHEWVRVLFILKCAINILNIGYLA